MAYPRKMGILAMTLSLSILGVLSALADDCNSFNGYSNQFCLPGSFGYQAAQQYPGTLPYEMLKQQQCASPNGYFFNSSCPPGSVAYQEKQRRAAEAADPRNRNDPKSQYYAGTRAQQCENSRHSPACVLGISCAAPVDLHCGQEEGPGLLAHHRRKRF